MVWKTKQLQKRSAATRELFRPFWNPSAVRVALTSARYELGTQAWN